MTIKLEDLDNVKLVRDENIASATEAIATVESACVQGSQAWGVRRDTGVILKLARDLKIALALAAATDAAQRALKGEQMSHGRTRARLTNLEAEHEAAQDEISRQTKAVDRLTAEVLAYESRYDDAP